MPISPAYSLFLCMYLWWVEIGKHFTRKEISSAALWSWYEIIFCLLFSHFLLQHKKSARLNLFAGAQCDDCHDEHHLQPQCGRQVLLRCQDNKNNIFQVLHRGLCSRLCQERSLRDQALSPNLLARLDGQSWQNCDILSARKEITTLHAISANLSLSKKCQNHFGQGGPHSQFGQWGVFLSGKSSLKYNTKICPEIAN